MKEPVCFKPDTQQKGFFIQTPRQRGGRIFGILLSRLSGEGWCCGAFRGVSGLEAI